MAIFTKTLSFTAKIFVLLLAVAAFIFAYQTSQYQSRMTILEQTSSPVASRQ